MADIQSKILGKYDIDIAQENIFKLYKIDTITLSSDELETKIQETRKRWLTSSNGANEKNAKRDRERLEKADKYEAILKDVKLRKEVFHFYAKSTGGGSSTGGEANTKKVEFAKGYFELVATTKKIRSSDVEFFFHYYQGEKKNKKAILEMLRTEMKIKGLGKEEKYSEENDNTDEEERKKKNDSGTILVSRFGEATVIKIRRAIENYELAVTKNTLCQKYPKLNDGLYEYLAIDRIENSKEFTELMTQRGKEVFAMRQEYGSEYIPLVDLFNILKDVGEYQDVVDNISEFKLLLKYPNLTPYMFSFTEVKSTTIKGMANVAKQEYSFRDDNDFILNYYKLVRDNFCVSDSGIRNLLKNAEKKATANQILNKVDEKLGRKKGKKNENTIVFEIIHWLVYWPVFMVYLLFEIAKVIFTNLSRCAVPVFVGIFLLQNWLLPKLDFGIDNLLILRKLFLKEQWLSYLNEFWGDHITIGSGWEAFILSTIVIIILLAIYVLPGLFIYLLIGDFAGDFNKGMDWDGFERTFQFIFSNLRSNAKAEYEKHPKIFIKRKCFSILINIGCMIVLIALIYLVPIGLNKLSEITGYGLKTEETFSEKQVMDEKEVEEVNTFVEEEEEKVNTMVITESSANIRLGPSVDYGVATVAKKGDVFVATGNQETASNGTIWYEVYLDEERAETAWGSGKVMELQQED